MALTGTQINNVIQEFFEEEVAKKKKDSNHRIFLSESYLINKLNAKTDEDIKNIRTCASTFVDTINSVSSPNLKIDTDIDDYEMVRARAFRKQELEPTLGKSRNSGCLGTIVTVVVVVCVFILFLS